MIKNWQSLTILSITGYELSHGHGEGMVRVGVGYDIPVGRMFITPTVNVDFVDSEEVLVYGLAFGFGF